MKNKKIEVLLVEDNPDDAELALLAFKKANIIEDSQIHIVSDGVEALEYLFNIEDEDDLLFNIEDEDDLRLNHRPQLILLDLKLPKLGGLDLLKKIKSHPESKKIPVVILTGSKDIKDWIDSYDLGAECFLHKSADFSQLVEAAGMAVLGAFEIEKSSGG